MTIPGQHIYCNVKHIQELDSVFYIEIINNFDYFYCIGSSKKKANAEVLFTRTIFIIVSRYVSKLLWSWKSVIDLSATNKTSTWRGLLTERVLRLAPSAVRCAIL